MRKIDLPFAVSFLFVHLYPLLFFVTHPVQGIVCPCVAGETNWGKITQEGRRITIEGHPHWIATGEIRKDGKVKVQWVEISTGRPAPGLYTIKGEDLDGEWGWNDECQWLENGTLVGNLRGERIVKVSKE